MERLPEIPALLAGAAGTLLRGRGPWPADGLAPVSFSATPPNRRDAYDRFFGGLRGQLPLLYGYAQRAQLAAMLRPGFPFRVPGLIHLTNAQRLLAEPDPTAGYVLEVRSTLEAGDGKTAVAFDVDFRAEEQVFATCRSTYLVQRERRAGGPRELPPPLEGDQARWPLAADEGRRYAALSGDYNPIHLTPWLSRLFGFPRPIMHGMNAAARALVAIERAQDRPVTQLDVAFKRPIPLPADVVLTWTPAGAFQVRSLDGATLHLEGQAAG